MTLGKQRAPKDSTRDGASPPPSPLRAAEYVRMSNEHQQFATENQRDKIKEYATRRSIEIVRTYADEGKSGLRIDGRLALQRLIKDVENGLADFKVILVYDVSRWGRFQDADGPPSVSSSPSRHLGSPELCRRSLPPPRRHSPAS